jgi:hypothetical protein
MSNFTDKQILDTIVVCDSRFVRFTEKGYVLLMETIDGNSSEVEMTPNQFADECNVTVSERFFALTDMTMSDISGTNITPSSTMVDVLLDLRSMFEAERHAHQNTARLWVDAFRLNAAYRLQYGDIDFGDESDDDLDESESVFTLA